MCFLYNRNSRTGRVTLICSSDIIFIKILKFTKRFMETVEIKQIRQRHILQRQIREMKKRILIIVNRWKQSKQTVPILVITALSHRKP